MGDSIVLGQPKTLAEALRKQAHAAWVRVTMDRLLPALRKVARAKGYALAAHGSWARDVDLIAVPWTDTAVSADELHRWLLGTVKVVLDCGYVHEDWAVKPHGRRARNIHIGWHCYLDISIMPRIG